MRPPPSEAYLADYARRFELPLLLDTRAEVVEPAEGGGFLARTNRGTISARHVVVATGPFSRPAVPAAGEGLDAEVVQLHSAEYQRPSDIGTGDVLVFGGGNSAVVPAGRDPRDQPVLVARDLVSRLAAGELSHRTGQQPLATHPRWGRVGIMKAENQRAVLNRLKTSRGHLEGIIRMVEEDAYCPDLMKQLSAVQGSLERAGRIVLRNHLETCVAAAMVAGRTEEIVDELMEALRFDRIATGPLPESIGEGS